MIHRLFAWLFPPDGWVWVPSDGLLVDQLRAVVAADPQVPKPRKL